jgi:hypothetical protein
MCIKTGYLETITRSGGAESFILWSSLLMHKSDRQVANTWHQIRSGSDSKEKIQTPIQQTEICFLLFSTHFIQLTIFLLHLCVSKSFRTGHLEWELQMVQLSAIRWSCIAILWVRLVIFAAMLCFSTSVYCCCKRSIFRYWLSSETFGYTHLTRK